MKDEGRAEEDGPVTLLDKAEDASDLRNGRVSFQGLLRIKTKTRHTMKPTQVSPTMRTSSRTSLIGFEAKARRRLWLPDSGEV